MSFKNLYRRALQRADAVATEHQAPDLPDRVTHSIRGTPGPVTFFSRDYENEFHSIDIVQCRMAAVDRCGIGHAYLGFRPYQRNKCHVGASLFVRRQKFLIATKLECNRKCVVQW
jgi:hypothetical protein